MMTQKIPKNENSIDYERSVNESFEKDLTSFVAINKENEKINKMILENIDDVSIIAITDKNGTITYANKKFCEISKYPKEELIGQNHRILKSEHHPKSFFEDMWKTISSGNVWKGYIKNRAKDGSFYWVKTTIIPYFNNQKEIDGYISFRIDVTKKLSIKEKLKESDQKFQKLYDSTPAMLATIDSEGRIIEHNSSFIEKFDVNCQSQEIFLFDLISNNHTSNDKKIFVIWKEKQEEINREIILKDKNDLEFPAKIKIKRTSNQKNPLGHLSIIDLSEKKYSDALIQTLKDEKMIVLGELSAHFSHDIRNPLSIISNSAEILELKSKTEISEDAKDEIERIKRAVNRISHQVEDVLDYVRISKFSKEVILFSDIVEYVIDKTKIPTNVDVQLENCDVNVLCDQTKLSAVISNLFLNSIQAIGNKPGKILIKCIVNGNVTILIQDSGAGVDSKIQKKIFEPLFTTKQHGTGLGLASCKNLVEGHGGNLTFTNNPTTFKISLPLI